MSREPLVTKPASGHWSDAYPELGRGPVSFEDCVSQEFHDREIEHIFKKTWAYVGRAEQLPNKGCYFTREFAFAQNSVIVVRGNKLVWRDDPFQETQGHDFVAAWNKVMNLDRF